VRLWDAATGKPLGTAMHHQNQVTAVAISPDSKTVLTGSHDKTARLWDAATGKPLGAVLQHQYAVVSVAYSPDGKTVLTGSHDKTARLWDAANGKPLGKAFLHQGGVRAVAYSPDARTVITCSDDSTARLWKVPRALDGDSERVLLWSQIITGCEIDEHGNPRVLGADEWRQRRDHLDKLGGPP